MQRSPRVCSGRWRRVIVHHSASAFSCRLQWMVCLAYGEWCLLPFTFKFSNNYMCNAFLNFSLSRNYSASAFHHPKQRYFFEIHFKTRSDYASAYVYMIFPDYSLYTMLYILFLNLCPSLRLYCFCSSLLICNNWQKGSVNCRTIFYVLNGTYMHTTHYVHFVQNY